MLTPTPHRSPTRSFSLAARARAVAVILAEEFGVPFRLYDAVLGQEVNLPEPLRGPAPCWEPLAPAGVLALVQLGKARVVCTQEGVYRLATVLFEASSAVLVAEGMLAGQGGSTWLVEQERTQRWLQAVSDRIRLTEQVAAHRRAEEEQTAQVKRAWTAVLGIDEAVRQVKIHREPGLVRQRLLLAGQELLGCQALVWTVGEEKARQVAFQGEAILPSNEVGHLIGLLAQQRNAGRPGELSSALVLWNEDRAGLWSARLPRIRNLLAAPLPDSTGDSWLIALNSATGTSFRRADAAAILPLASLFALHLRGNRRFQELKNLLVGLTRSLTAAIDAKDSYTFGHSERVARIGRELGRELGLCEDDLSDIYLAGLLHDIGKIGIRDTVLLKPGPLTPEEFEHIKEHPVIGYKILAELVPLRNLLPGVRSHHERWDGLGYPDGLGSEEIPLLARVLAVADSYDAMGTPRPYREALSIAEIERRLQEGAGSQWDARVVEGFMGCRQRLHSLRQPVPTLQEALDGALRTGDSSRCFPVRGAQASGLR